MRTALRIAGWAAGGAALAVALLVTVPLAFGARPYTVLTGSMEPAVGAGDVVVVKRIHPVDAHPGDIVTFEAPDPPRRLITHRVRSVRPAGGQIAFVTKGDANNAVERWRIDRGGDISRMVYRVPEVGRLAVFTRRREGLLIFVILPLLALGAQEIRRIWKPREDPGEAAA